MRQKIKEILNTINENLELRESDNESDEKIITTYFKKHFIDLIVYATSSYALLNP